ncbi:MAG: glutathione S-transferase family protein [Wenzhouxiangellaceae bacterium]
MNYTLYYSPDSCNLSVRFVLETLGRPYVDRLVDRSRHEHRSESFRKLNPQGLLPVLTDGDTSIFETGAICLYLADRHGALFPAPQSHQRGPALKWLFFVANGLHAELRMYWYAERYAGPAGAADMRAMLAQRIKHSWRIVEQQLARHDGRTITGSVVPGIVDFYAAHLARTSALYPIGMEAMPGDWRFFPHIRQWLARLQTSTAVANACGKEGIAAPFLLEPQRPAVDVRRLVG